MNIASRYLTRRVLSIDIYNRKIQYEERNILVEYPLEHICVYTYKTAVNMFWDDYSWINLKSFRTQMKRRHGNTSVYLLVFFDISRGVKVLTMHNYLGIYRHTISKLFNLVRSLDSRLFSSLSQSRSFALQILPRNCAALVIGKLITTFKEMW